MGRYVAKCVSQVSVYARQRNVTTVVHNSGLTVTLAQAGETQTKNRNSENMLCLNMRHQCELTLFVQLIPIHRSCDAWKPYHTCMIAGVRWTAV